MNFDIPPAEHFNDKPNPYYLDDPMTDPETKKAIQLISTVVWARCNGYREDCLEVLRGLAMLVLYSPHLPTRVYSSAKHPFAHTDPNLLQEWDELCNGTEAPLWEEILTHRDDDDASSADDETDDES